MMKNEILHSSDDPASLSGDETWRQLTEFLDYEISTNGVIRRITTSNCSKAGHVMSTYIREHDGEPAVVLRAAKVKRARALKYLMASVFMPPKPSTKSRLVHVNGDKSDCRLNNLCWSEQPIHRESLAERKKTEQDEDLPGEQWKTCLRFPEFEISNMGRLKRLVDRWGSHAGRILKPYRYGDGKPTYKVGLRNALVHMLVAEVFLPQKPHPDSIIRYKDGDHSNYAASNLYWGPKNPNITLDDLLHLE